MDFRYAVSCPICAAWSVAPFTSPSTLASHPLCTQLFTRLLHTLRSLSVSASGVHSLTVRAEKRSGRQKWDNQTDGTSATPTGMVTSWSETQTVACITPRATSSEGLAFDCLHQCPGLGTQSVLSKCLLNEKTDTHQNYQDTESWSYSRRQGENTGLLPPTPPHQALTRFRPQLLNSTLSMKQPPAEKGNYVPLSFL